MDFVRKASPRGEKELHKQTQRRKAYDLREKSSVSHKMSPRLKRFAAKKRKRNVEDTRDNST